MTIINRVLSRILLGEKILKGMVGGGLNFFLGGMLECLGRNAASLMTTAGDG